MKLKEAMKLAKETGKRVKVTEPTPITEIKVNLSIRLDLDVLNWFKAEGQRTGIPYQTLINSALKGISQKPSLEERVAALEKQHSEKAG